MDDGDGKEHPGVYVEKKNCDDVEEGIGGGGKRLVSNLAFCWKLIKKEEMG